MNTRPGRWLITGSAGYLASNLLALEPEYLDNAVLLDLADCSLSGNQVFFPSRFGDTKNLEDFFSNIELLGVIHLAALKSIPDSYLDPQKYHKINFEDSVSLFNFAKRKGVKKFIFASSAAVYSPAIEREITTEESACFPLSPYGISKREFEEFLSSNQSKEIDIYSLRFFNLAGGKTNATFSEGAINAALQAGLHGKTFFVNGGIEGLTSSLNSARDYISVIDAAKAINACAKDSNDHSFDTYNISTGDATFLRDIIRIVEEAIGGTIKMAPSENFSKEVNWMVGNPSKMNQKFGWKANSSVREIIEELVNENSSR